MLDIQNYRSERYCVICLPDVGPYNDIKGQECVADKTYWILAVVLGIALLVVTMVTMYFFCRMRSEQQRVDMIDGKSGFKNPAF
ncbi:hypothetical protein DPMN_083507 [Dreissena polymorpha]|uniref:Uncharacterized protein n=1 Tax=Dreissena polymorpha TaxID=45954 RepID=A0A9D3YCQ0_DREPO|nr:hypothetical protein DPMN_083507 [Dreissena polymorpha]